MMKERLYIFAKELFQFSCGTYLFLIIGEAFKTGFASMFINLYLILGIILISGITMLFTYSEFTQVASQNSLTGSDIEKAILLTLLGSFAIYSLTKDLGLIALIITGIVACILLLVVIMIYKED